MEETTAALQEDELEKHEADDRISSLPDDILLLILNKLRRVHDAARTTVLSKRWRHLLGLRSEIVLDVVHFNPSGDDEEYSTGTLPPSADALVRANSSVVEATKSILRRRHRGYSIDRLGITFCLRDESMDIVRAVDDAMAANHNILAAEFTVIPEELNTEWIYDDVVLANGRRFMSFVAACPRAFSGLTGLSLHSLRLGGSDIPTVLGTCKKLEILVLYNCDAGIRSELQVEHSELAELRIGSCNFEKVELKWLPRLARFLWKDWLPSQDPLSFGYVPQLWTLVLSNGGTIWHKSFKLSEFLRNAVIGELVLDFQCQRIWIQPESSKRLAPALRNLQMVSLYSIHEECDLTWTLFFLEAAPLLKELEIQVWDHTCHAIDEKDEYREFEFIYQKANASLKWEACNGFKHYNLRNLTVAGFQVEEKFMSYIRHLMETAVNLQVVSLFDSRTCQCCGFHPQKSYPRTAQDVDQLSYQANIGLAILTNYN